MRIFNTTSVNIVRGISDIQNGIPIILKYKRQTKVILAIERIDIKVFDRIKAISKNIDIVISHQRAAFLQINESKINCNKLHFNEIERIVFSHQRINVKSFIFSQKIYIDNIILKLLKICELLPSALIITLNSDAHFGFNMHSIHIDDINIFLSQINNELYEVCSANLELQFATGVIKCFRSQFFKDHYAVIINSKNTNIINHQPLLRVHSSCFTGDILQSIRCDCYQQLHNAIKIMSKNNGGILLYLNQEGRGIGLTNKIRVYKSQALGFDTIEANQNLGFEADLRNFSIAAKILKLLEIRTVDLLSNNPNKTKNLIDNGIIVKNVIPHQFLNQKNIQYYKNKIKFFTHNTTT